jgi:hypothetical protein
MLGRRAWAAGLLAGVLLGCGVAPIRAAQAELVKVAAKGDKRGLFNRAPLPRLGMLYGSRARGGTVAQAKRAAIKTKNRARHRARRKG